MLMKYKIVLYSMPLSFGEGLGEVRRFSLVKKVKMESVFFISVSKQTNIRDFQFEIKKNK